MVVIVKEKGGKEKGERGGQVRKGSPPVHISGCATTAVVADDISLSLTVNFWMKKLLIMSNPYMIS